MLPAYDLQHKFMEGEEGKKFKCGVSNTDYTIQIQEETNFDFSSGHLPKLMF